MKKVEVMYHEKCCCLDADGIRDNKCLKRYYIIYDFKKDINIQLYVCNETIRLMMNNEMKKDQKIDRSYYYYPKEKSFFYEKAIMNIIREHIYFNSEYSIYRSSMSNDLFDKYVPVQVCDRPRLYNHIPITKALDYIFEDGYHSLTEDVLRVILEYMKNITYKKYKTRYQNVLSKVKKLNRNIFLKDEERQIIINEIMLEVFKTKVKLKKQ